MNITVFDNVIVESSIAELEAEGAKYDGLYVDMNNAPERKYVKDKAAEIKGILKRLDRVRIDSVKEFKVEVEKQANLIRSRLEDANSNFQVLIDDYTIERKKILDAEKAEREAIEMAVKIEVDHEFALLLNKQFDADKKEREAKQKEYEEQLKAQAIKEQTEQAERDRIANQQALEAAEKRRIDDIKAAKQAEIARQQQEKAAAEQAERARLANVEHVRGINSAALNDLLKLGLSENNAKAVISAIAKNTISNITINY